MAYLPQSMNTVNGLELTTSDSFDYVQWLDSPAAGQCRNMLQKQLYWAKVNRPLVYNYLMTNCSSVYNPPVGHTGVPVSIFEGGNIVSSDNVVSLKSDFSNAYVSNDLSNSGGTYVIYIESTNKYYIGACIDFKARLAQHYYAFKHDGQSASGIPFYAAVAKHGDMGELVWKPVAPCSNHFRVFAQKHPEDASDYMTYRLLTDVTKYESRLVEEALKAHLDDKLLNGPGGVTFPTNWDPDDIRQTFYARPFTVYANSGLTFEIYSINQGAQILGISRKTIEVVINYDVTVECPGINDEARLQEKGTILKQGSPYPNPYQAVDLDVGIDYSELSPNVLHVFNEELEKVATFENATEAADACGLKNYYSVTRYINKRFIQIIFGGVTMLALFAKNPLTMGRTKGIVGVHLLTGAVTCYFSINDLLADICWAGDGSWFIKKHLKNGILLNDVQYMYATDYKGILPPVTEVSKKVKEDYASKILSLNKR